MSPKYRPSRWDPGCEEMVVPELQFPNAIAEYECGEKNKPLCQDCIDSRRQKDMTEYHRRKDKTGDGRYKRIERRPQGGL